MIGVAFGLSGGLFQTMLRNPLASPDVIGISYGASAGRRHRHRRLRCLRGGRLRCSPGRRARPWPHSSTPSPAAAHSDPAAADGAATRPATGSSWRASGIAAALHAVVNFLMTRADIRTAADVLVWLNGSLNSASWDRAGVLGAGAAGPDSGRRRSWPGRCASSNSATTPPRDWASASARTRLGVVITAVALAAVATAAAGPVAFVAFLAGPIARRFTGKASLPASALVGALIVLAADYFAANIAPLLLDGTVLPVGVITGALGAPFLLWLLVTSNRKDA